MSVRLPIYRSLSRQVEIFGLSLWEIAFLVTAFVFLTEILFFVPHRTLISFAIVFICAGILRHLNKRFDRHFLARLIRFAALPERLHRRNQNAS